MSIQRSQIYYISSEMRNSGRGSNFNFTIDIPEGQHFDSVVVLSMSIPLSFYLIRPPYNTMILREDSIFKTITVPEGNYDAKNFMSVFKTLLNTNSPNGRVYNISIDIQTASYNFTVSGNTSQPSFIIGHHLGDQLGFDVNSTNDFVGNSLTSSDVINFVSTNCLYLHSDIVDDKTSILQEVYSNNTIPYSYIVYNCVNPDLYSKRLKTNTSSSFNFSLTDDHNIEIDLNGHEIAVTLMLYKKLTIGDIFKKYIESQMK